MVPKRRAIPTHLNYEMLPVTVKQKQCKVSAAAQGQPQNVPFCSGASSACLVLLPRGSLLGMLGSVLPRGSLGMFCSAQGQPQDTQFFFSPKIHFLFIGWVSVSSFRYVCPPCACSGFGVPKKA